MNMKTLVACAFLLFLFNNFSFAQQLNKDSSSTQNKDSLSTAQSQAAASQNTTTVDGNQNSINTPSLTSVLPPAPNAFELTRYSGLPINLSTGSVSAKIPLGDVKAGKVDVPVLLSYNSGNGVLMNQQASRTGIGWTLEAGGVITRAIHGNPDE